MPLLCLILLSLAVNVSNYSVTIILYLISVHACLVALTLAASYKVIRVNNKYSCCCNEHL